MRECNYRQHTYQFDMMLCMWRTYRSAFQLLSWQQRHICINVKYPKSLIKQSRLPHFPSDSANSLCFKTSDKSTKATVQRLELSCYHFICSVQVLAKKQNVPVNSCGCTDAVNSSCVLEWSQKVFLDC
jgi:hypothetical protein